MGCTPFFIPSFTLVAFLYSDQQYSLQLEYTPRENYYKIFSINLYKALLSRLLTLLYFPLILHFFSSCQLPSPFATKRIKISNNKCNKCPLSIIPLTFPSLAPPPPFSSLSSYSYSLLPFFTLLPIVPLLSPLATKRIKFRKNKCSKLPPSIKPVTFSTLAPSPPSSPLPSYSYSPLPFFIPAPLRPHCPSASPLASKRIKFYKNKFSRLPPCLKPLTLRLFNPHLLLFGLPLTLLYPSTSSPLVPLPLLSSLEGTKFIRISVISCLLT